MTRNLASKINLDAKADIFYSEKKKTPQIAKNKAKKETNKRDPAAEKQKAKVDWHGTILLNIPVTRNLVPKINSNAKCDNLYANNRKHLKSQNKSKKKAGIPGTKRKNPGWPNLQ